VHLRWPHLISPRSLASKNYSTQAIIWCCLCDMFNNFDRTPTGDEMDRQTRGHNKNVSNYWNWNNLTKKTKSTYCQRILVASITYWPCDAIELRSMLPVQHHADVMPSAQVVWKNKVRLMLFTISILSLQTVINSIHVMWHHCAWQLAPTSFQHYSTTTKSSALKNTGVVRTITHTAIKICKQILHHIKVSETLLKFILHTLNFYCHIITTSQAWYLCRSSSSFYLHNAHSLFVVTLSRQPTDSFLMCNSILARYIIYAVLQSSCGCSSVCLSQVLLKQKDHETWFVQTVKYCFQDFPGLAKTKFQGFPGLTKLVFNDFPG